MAQQNRDGELPEQPDLDPERTVDELERRVMGTGGDKTPPQDRSDTPIFEQDLDPDEDYTPEPPA